MNPRDLFAATSLTVLVAAGSALGQGKMIVNKDGTPNPAYSGLYAWFRADSGVNGAAGLAEDGASVTRWNDSSVNARDLVRFNADVNRQAVMNHDGANGGATVEFDGNDFIWANQTTEFGTVSGGRTIFAVVRADAADGGYVFDSCTSAGRNALFTGQASNPEEWVAYTGTAVIGCGPVAVSEVSVVALSLADGAQTIRVGGEIVATDVAGLQNLPGLLLGARYTTSNGLFGGIAEVMVYAESLTEGDLVAIEDYLIGKYAAETPCPADINGDLLVDSADLGLLIAAWNTADDAIDIDGSGNVDSADLGLLIASWGACP